MASTIGMRKRLEVERGILSRGGERLTPQSKKGMVDKRGTSLVLKGKPDLGGRREKLIV